MSETIGYAVKPAASKGGMMEYLRSACRGLGLVEWEAKGMSILTLNYEVS